MNNVQFLAWLNDNDACKTAVERVGAKSAQEVWDNWDNPSELLWWVEESGLVSKQEITLLICGIVRNTPLTDGRTVWDLLADERSRNAVEVAERWAHGKATDGKRAAAAAWAAWAWAGAAWAVWAAEAVWAAGAWAVWAGAAWAGAAARVWQLAYIRKQLPDFVERFTEAHSSKCTF